MSPPTPSHQHLRTTEERLARLSVLQELTVTALDLFDPDSSADPFLERLADRLGCVAAAWVVVADGAHASLVGAAGLSEASRALRITEPAGGGVDPSDVTFPYPELARRDLVRWAFPLRDPVPAAGNEHHALLLWFDPERKPPEEYRPAVERLVGVLETVLTHRRLAQDLRRSYEELARTQLVLVERERLAAVGELAAVVAHEVRNPLAVIFNCIGTLQKSSKPPGESKAILGILSEEANRLNQIVSELLDFARPGEVMMMNDSLEEIVAGAIGAVKAAQAYPVDVELEVPRPLPLQPLDARLVRRAVVNLVTNAVQAMPEGGRVRVRLVDDPSAQPPSTRLEVSDEGPGIASEVRARIFEPFFTTKSFGTGLGLSVVKHVAEAHHGDVTVRSKPGHGTTFVIRLPSTRR